MPDIGHGSLQLPAAVAASIYQGPFFRPEPPHVRPNDPASCVMSDFVRERPRVIDEDRGIQAALDEMFLCGVRAFLVIRQEQDVVGFVTVEQLLECRRRAGVTIGEVMTPADAAPLIDWQTVRDATVADLREIFAGAGVDHLVVVETESAARSTVRGLIHRKRLIRQLRAPI